MEQFDLSQIPFATPEIAESWKRGCEKDALKQPLPMRYLVWIEINERPGISWRQLNEIFTKHSLSVALLWLREKGLIKRIESTWFDERGRKPTQYFAVSRPFMVAYAKTVRLKHDRGDFLRGDKEDFYGSLVTVWSEPKPSAIKVPGRNSSYPFKTKFRRTIVKRFIRLTHEERKRLDATLVQIAAGKRPCV